MVAKVLTIGVAFILLVTVGPAVVNIYLNPSSESFVNLVEAGAVNWWVPIAEAAPLLFVIMAGVFIWAGVGHLLEA